MDQRKTGRLIAEQRKSLGLTQARLAEELHVSGQAVSKWETGRSVPDPAIMVALCDMLGISVNELLNGEKIDMDDYKRIAEETLVRMRMLEEEKNRQLLSLEWVVGTGSSVSFLVMVFTASFADGMPWWARAILIVVGAVLFAVGATGAIWIEQVAGYYECPSCGHRRVPSTREMWFSPHLGRSRRMLCPECDERGYHRKVLLANEDAAAVPTAGATDGNENSPGQSD